MITPLANSFPLLSLSSLASVVILHDGIYPPIGQQWATHPSLIELVRLGAPSTMLAGLATSPSELSQSLTYSSPEFAIAANMQYPANSQSLPDWDTLNASNFGIGGGLPAEMQLDQPPWLASFGGDYPQAQQGAEMMPYQMQSLTQQQQLDLMASELPTSRTFRFFIHSLAQTHLNYLKNSP